MILGHNWFYRPRIDAELKKYETLAFIQYLENCLRNKIIAHPLDEILIQKNSIEHYLQQSSNSDFALDKKINSVDWSLAKINYSYKRDECLNEIDEIAGFMLKMISPYLQHFSEMKEKLLNEIQMTTVGIIPSYEHEGWMLMNENNCTTIFRFNSTRIINETGFHTFQTDYVFTCQNSIDNSPEKMKLDLIEKFPELPQPMTYYFTSQQNLPLYETYLPLAIEKVQQQQF